MNATIVLAACGALFVTPTTRAADSELSALSQQIAKAAREQPKSFQALDSLKRRLPELDKRKRGRLAVLTPVLKSMGQEALLPMLGELLKGAKGPELLPAARTAWAASLLEAVAALEDPRGLPVAQRMLAVETDPDVVRAAALAVGATGGAASAQALADLARQPGPKQLPVVSALAQCRQLEAAEVLGELLAKHPEEEIARVAAKSLGQLASEWVWEIPTYASRPDRDAIRSAAAKALVATFLAYREGEVRTQAETSLQIVRAAETVSLIEKAKPLASPADRVQLDRLAAKLAPKPKQ
ncbi:MAG: hypothetical protein HY901_32290 [Deltaproteobacteria bacterium]|nr:hypothetical protein [Deltaproteobacteria bacterium]